MNRRRHNRMRINWRLASLVLIGLLVAGSLVFFSAGRQEASINSSLEALGFVEFEGSVAAPDFTLTDLSGNPVRLSALRGKVVFLTFWTTW